MLDELQMKRMSRELGSYYHDVVLIREIRELAPLKQDDAGNWIPEDPSGWEYSIKVGDDDVIYDSGWANITYPGDVSVQEIEFRVDDCKLPALIQCIHKAWHDSQ